MVYVELPPVTFAMPAPRIAATASLTLWRLSSTACEAPPKWSVWPLPLTEIVSM
jgi:hypothetical protein